MTTIDLVYINSGGGPGLAGQTGQFVRSPRSPRRISQNHRGQAGRLLQRAPRARLDPRPGAGTAHSADADSPEPQIVSESAAAALAGNATRPGRLHGAEFQ